MPSKKSTLEFGVKFTTDQASVNAVKKSLQDIQNIKFKDFNGPNEQLRKIRDTAAAVEQALTKAFNVNLGTLNTKQFNQELKQTVGSVDQVYTQFSKLGAQGKVAFSQMASSVLTTNLQLKQTSSLISSMGQTMANTVKWGIASSVMNSFTNSVRSAFDYIKGLDAALTDIRIVTGDSTEQMRQFAEQANRTAQTLGRSTMDYTKAALTFYQQGLDEQSVQARTQSVLTAQNITGAGEQMADYLTAVWNGYKVANEEAELYVDKLAAVADSSASNMSQLAIAMSKVASTANMLGVPVDSLNAQIATIVATTRQAPETVGNALKTIYARINDITTGADDAEVSLGNYTKQMAALGVSVLDSNGKLRDTGDVIEQIGGKWETLSREQQIYLARTMAGQRQYNNLLALFENWSKYSDLVTVSMDAQGAAAEKNSRYMESLSAKLEQFGVAGERVKSSLIDEESLKKIVDFGTNAVNVFGSLIQSIGGGSGALLNFGSIFASLFSNTIAKQINNVVTNLQRAHNNAEILKQDIENTQTFKVAAPDSQSVQTITTKLQDIQKYYSVMDAESINIQKNLIDELGLLENSKEKLQQKQRILTEYAKTIGILDSNEIWNEQSAQFQIINQELGELSGNAITLEQLIENFNEGDVSLKNLRQGFQAFLSNYNSLSPDKAKILQEAFKEVNEDTEFISGNLRTLLFGAIEEAKVKGDSFAETLSTSKQEMRGLTSQSEKLSNNIDRNRDSFRQAFDIQSIVNFASSLGQLAAVTNNVVNIFKIWRNENLSTGQKILQTFTNLTMTAGMLFSAISRIRDSWKGVTDLIIKVGNKIYNQNAQNTAGKVVNTVATQANKKAEDDLTASRKAEGDAALEESGKVATDTASKTANVGITEKAAGANLGFAGSIGQIISVAGPFIAIAAAVATAIYAIYKAWNAQAEAAEEANKAAESTKKTFEQTKQAYEDLKSSFQKYNSIQDSLKNLTSGTQEWRDAIQECNDVVLQLLNNYPQLEQYVSSTNGKLQISEAGQAEALRLASDSVNNTRLASTLMTNRARDYNATATAAGINHEIHGIGLMLGNAATGLGASGMAYANVSNLTQAGRDQAVIEVAKALNDGIIDNQKIAELANISERQVQEIRKEQTALNQLRDQLRQNQSATKLQTESMAAEALQNDSIYQGFDDLEKQIVNTIGGKTLDIDVEDFIRNDTSFKNVNRFSGRGSEQLTDILNRFRDAMQDQTIDWQSNAVSGSGGREFNFIIDGQQVTYTKEQVAATIASKQALQELGITAKNTAKMLSEIDKIGDQSTSTAIKNFIAGNGFGDLTKDELGVLAGLKEEDFTELFNLYGEQLQKIGYHSAGQFSEAFLEGVDSDTERINKAGEKYLTAVQKAFNIVKDDKSLTANASQAISGALNEAFIHGGQQGLNSLSSLLKDLPSEDLNNFSSLLENIDWSDPNAAYNLTQAVKEQGIAIDTTSSTWQTFIAYLEEVSGKSLNAASAIDKVRESLKGISDIKDLEAGQIIDDEEYEKIIALNPALKEFFKIAADGYMFIGTQEKIADIVGDNVQQTIGHFRELQEAAKRVANADLTETSNAIDIDSQNFTLEGVKDLNKLQRSTAFSNALASMGLSEQAFDDAANWLKEEAQKAAQEGYQVNKEAWDENTAIVQNALNTIAGLQADYNAGNFAQDAMRSMLATSAESLEELRNLYYTIDEQTSQNLISSQDYMDLRDVMLQRQVERLNTTKEAYQETGAVLRQHLEQVSDSFKQLEENAQQIELDQLTSRIYQLGDALDQLAEISDDKLDEFQEAINEGFNLNDIEGFGEFKETLSQIFDTDISTDQIAEHFDLIRRLAQGDITALTDLQYALAQDYVAKIEVDPNLESAESARNAFQTFLSNYPLQDLQVGISLDDAGFTQALTEFANMAGLTADQVNQLLANIGFEPQVIDQEIPFKEINTGQHGYEYSYTYTDPITGETQVIPITVDQYDAAQSAGSITIPIINGKKIKYTGGASAGKLARPKYSGNSPSKSGGKGGGGKGSSKKPTVVKPPKAPEAKETIDQRSDPYHDINLALEKQEDKIKDIQNAEKHLTDYQRLENLQKQNDQLEKQNSLFEDKITIAEGQLARIGNELQDSGISIKFNSDGTIANYNEALDNALKNYNAAVDTRNTNVNKAYQDYLDYITKYNAMTAEQQQAHKDQLEKVKDNYEEIVKAEDKALSKQKEKYDAIKNNIKSYEDTIDIINDLKEKYKENIEQIRDHIIEISKIKVDLSIDSGQLEREWLDFENKVIKKLDKDDFLGNAKANVKELMSYFDSEQVQQVNDQIARVRQAIATIQAGGSDSIYGTRLGDAEERLSELLKQQQDQLKDIQDLVDKIKDNYLDALDDAKDKMDDQIDQYERINDLIDHNVKLTQLLYGDKAYDTMNKYYDMQKDNNEQVLQNLRMQQIYWQNQMNNEEVGSDAWKKMKENVDDITDQLNSKLEDMIENLSDQWQNRVNQIIDKLNNALTGGRGVDYLDEQWDYINNFDDNFLDPVESRMGINEITSLYQQAIDGLTGSPKQQEKINKLMNDQLKLLREKDNLTQYDLDRAKASLEVEKARLALEEARDNKTKMRLRRDSQGNYTYQYVADEEKLSDLQQSLADAEANLYNMDKEHYKQNLNDMYDSYKDYTEKRLKLAEELRQAQAAGEEEAAERVKARMALLDEQYSKLMDAFAEDNQITYQVYLPESTFAGLGLNQGDYSFEEQMEIVNRTVPQAASNIQDLINKINGQGGFFNAMRPMIEQMTQVTDQYVEDANKILSTADTSVDTIMNVTDATGNALDTNIQKATNLIGVYQDFANTAVNSFEQVREVVEDLNNTLDQIYDEQGLVDQAREAYNLLQELKGAPEATYAENLNVADRELDTTEPGSGIPNTDTQTLNYFANTIASNLDESLNNIDIGNIDQQTFTNIMSSVLGAIQNMNSVANQQMASLTGAADGYIGTIGNVEHLDQNVHIEANFPNVQGAREIEEAFNNLVNMASMYASKYRD